jgi:hypothetical protein
VTSAATREATFDPGLGVADPMTRLWLRQATLRLRREVAWRWHERDAAGEPTDRLTAADAVTESLDLLRHWTAKQAFFQSDVAARYLSERIADPSIGEGGGWEIRGLRLDDVSALALALGLLARADAASGPIFGACLGDAHRAEPSLALVQRLADRPEQALALSDPGHPLWRYGLLQPREHARGAIPWDAAYGVPPLVAVHLLDPDAGWPPTITIVEPVGTTDDDAGNPVGDRLRIAATSLRIVPIDGPVGVDVRSAVTAVCGSASRRLAVVSTDAGDLAGSGTIPSLLTLAWLTDVDLLLVERSVPSSPAAPRASVLAEAVVAASATPATVFLRAGKETLGSLPREVVLPTVAIPRLAFDERVRRWRVALGPKAADVETDLPEAARRFRFEVETIDTVAAGLANHSARLERAALFDACRAALAIEIGGLAQLVRPRFQPDELILPPEQRHQYDEIEAAMRSLTEVHYGWGTARAWNEAGVAVLFAGPSGTGKTMAAEVLAVTLDIPMYRVNLAQVVDKYIGETEKNLERIFDAADESDTILFFDEADALFGKRTEVRDAHDRYANVEVAYLLERMERFKGLAILATNRRGDVDEAFLRRLRYIVDFPIPDAAERRRIWARVIPPAVDSGELDLDFLARQFQLTGGNIRSAVLNACLQTAAAERAARDRGRSRGNGSARSRSGSRPRLRMDHVLIAVKREHEKFQRTIGPAQFGRFAPVVEALSNG